MKMSEFDLHLCFSMMPVLTTNQKYALVTSRGSLREAWNANSRTLKKLVYLSNDNIFKMEAFKKSFDPSAFKKKIYEMGFKIITLNDESYPDRLKAIFDPPFSLFIKGKGIPECSGFIAVVGSRAATTYGLSVTEEIAEELSAVGVCVVSGGAMGIDAAAHRGALKGSTPTVAVLGCGIDIPYPRKNAALFEKISERGCIISEYPPGTKPNKWQFPARNRIVSGLSDGVTVVEAAAGSGALITAEFGLSEGRHVFAVPGNVKSPYSEGPHSLIKDGAILIESAKDIVNELSSQFIVEKKVVPERGFIGEEATVLSSVEWEPKTIDQICATTGKEISSIVAILAKLEVIGAIKQVEAQRYIRA